MIIDDGKNQENLVYFNSVILCDCLEFSCLKHKAMKQSESYEF